MALRFLAGSERSHLLITFFSPPPPSLGLLAGLGGGVVLGQRHALVAIPQLVDLGGLVLAAAGAAVPEAGQRRTHLHPLHRHGALDGFAKLMMEGGGGGDTKLRDLESVPTVRSFTLIGQDFSTSPTAKRASNHLNELLEEPGRIH